MTYTQKLKDPRWQRKRLEVLSRDDFTCRICGSTTKTLHVHHVRYIKGREPWEYREFYFVTLCEDCHKTEEDEIKRQPAKLYPKPMQQTVSAFDSMIEKAPEVPFEPADPEEMEAFFASLKGMLDSND